MKIIFNSDKKILNLDCQMKRFFLTILSALIFLASFQNSLILVDYQINRDFYEIHCVNKAKPELNCHGKCEMQKERSKNESLLKVVKYSFEFNILPSQEPELASSKNPDFKTNQQINTYKGLGMLKVYLNILPHPPQV